MKYGDILPLPEKSLQNIQIKYVRIPAPIPMDTRKGLRALSKGVPTSIRVHADDLYCIHVEAAELGVAPASFIRWAALFLARELRKERTGEDIEVHP